MKLNKTNSKQLQQRAKQLLDNSFESVKNVSTESFQTIIQDLLFYQLELEKENKTLKQTQDDLSNLHDKFQKLYDNSPVAYLTLNPQGIIIDANLTASSMFGVEYNKLIQKELLSFTHSDDITALNNIIKKLFSGEKPQTYNIRMKHKNGMPFYARLQALITIEAVNDSPLLQLVITDISELKTLEQKNKEMAKLTEDNINPVLRISSTGKILYANKVSNKLLKLWQASIGQIVCNDMKFIIADTYVSGKNRLLDIQTENTLYSLTITPISTKNYVNIYAYNITQQHKLANQLHQKEKMNTVGQLAGGIAHNFNNQLAGIIGYAELLILKQTNEKFIDYAKKIKTTAIHSAQLTKQLLAFARIGNFQSISVDIHQLINDIVVMLEHSVDKRTIITKKLSAIQHCVPGDPSQLKNAFLNIAVNACDAMPSGGNLLFSTKTEMLDANFCNQAPLNIVPGNYIIITITDSGHGMENGIKKQIFDPFFTTKEIGKGTGMGLASVYGTIGRHNGTISVTSDPEEGTVFQIYLPHFNAIYQQENPEIPKTVTKTNKINILLIDDDPIIRDVVSDVLEERNFNVVTACDGLEGVNFYKKTWHDIDLIILDMIMPRMGGHEALIELNKINPQVKVIISSGYSLANDLDNIVNKGVITYLYKPYTEYELILKIEETLSITLNCNK